MYIISSEIRLFKECLRCFHSKKKIVENVENGGRIEPRSSPRFIDQCSFQTKTWCNIGKFVSKICFYPQFLHHELPTATNKVNAVVSLTI